MRQIDNLTTAELEALDRECADLRLRYEAAVRAFDYHDKKLREKSDPWWMRALRRLGWEVTR